MMTLPDCLCQPNNKVKKGETVKISLEKISEYRKKLTEFCICLLSAVIIGAVGGVIGAFFAKSIGFATAVREENSFLIYLLPLGGLVSVGLYKLTKTEGVGTVRVLESARGESKVSVLLMPVIFAASVITHIFGGSAGKEGAALQIGGAIAEAVSRITRADDKKHSVYVICGMAALFSAVFGTPVGACVFALEVVLTGKMLTYAVFPVFVSSIIAHIVSVNLGVAPERFMLYYVPDFGINILLKVLAVATVSAIVSAFFCFLMHNGEKLFENIFKNSFIRIFTGGCIIVVLTLVFGTDYNGGGIAVIEHIFEEGSVRPEAFLLKILFTVITVSAGYRGGEIVPSLFIGASLGAVLSPLIGIPPEFGAAIGMISFFSGVTNAPVAAAFVGIELFGTDGLVFFALSAFAAKAFSGKISLYSKK